MPSSNATTLDFLSEITSNYPAGSDFLLELRYLSPSWDEYRPKPWPRQWYPLDRSELRLAVNAVKHYQKSWDCYFGVLPRLGRSGSQVDVHAANVIYQDIDGGSEGVGGAVKRILASGVPKPQIAVCSGGGVHAYWLLSEPHILREHADREQFKALLKRLCARIGGGATPDEAHADSSACEVARILRVPGSRNLKIKDNPRDVEILRFQPDTDRHTYAWWGSYLPADPVAVWDKPRANKPLTPAGFVSEGLLKWADSGYSEGNRHKDLTGAAAWLVRDVGLSRDDARLLLERKAAASGGRRIIPPTEIEAMVKWA